MRGLLSQIFEDVPKVTFQHQRQHQTIGINGIRGSRLNPKLEIWEKIGVVRGCSGRLFGSILGLFAARSGHLGPDLDHLGANFVQNTPCTR